MTAFKPLVFFQRHSDPPLQTPWNWAQLAVLLLPFSSLLGSLGILGVSVAVWKQKWRTIVRRPINQGFAVLSGLMLLSTIVAYRQPDALLGLFNFLPFFPVFAALSELIQTPAHLRRLAWILVLTSVPVVVIGLGQEFSGWAGQVKILWAVVDWTIDPTGNPPGRMASIFFYANVLASYLGISFILTLGLWIESIVRQSVARRQPLATANYKPQTANHTPLLTLILLGNTIALILTDSRNVWAIAVLSCLALALYAGWRWLLLGAGAIAAAVLGAAFGPSPLKEGLQLIIPPFFWMRLTDQLHPNRPIAELRTTQWRFAASLIQQRPWTGWGLRNFSPLYQQQMQFFVGHPHNLPLMLAAETGLPAMLLFVGLVGWIVAQASRLLIAASPSEERFIVFTYLTAFMGCAVFNLLDITLFDVRINLLGWVLLAAICGWMYRANHRIRPL